MKIIAIANAHALAHVSRLLEIARILRLKGHEILFAGHGKYLKVAEGDDFPTRELPYISIDQVINAVRSQKLGDLYPYSQIKEFVEQELVLYKEVNPDLVMIDNRPTARISADKAGLKTVAVLNVHMSPYRKIPFFSLRQKLNSGWAKWLTAPVDLTENLIENLFYDRMVMHGMNRLRREFGLKRLYSYEHEEGDLAFLADIPEFNPVRSLQPHASFVGPLTWHNDLPPPACLEQLDGHRRTVYFTLGSEGLEELADQFSTLTGMGLQIVVATGKTDRILGQKPAPNVFFEEYVNTDRLLPKCDLVCCHGGNGTLYQALAFGLPIVAVTTHAEQYYGARRVHQLGLGKVLTLKKVKQGGISLLFEAVEQVLQDPGYLRRAQAFSRHLQGWNGAELAATKIENYGLEHA